MTKKNKPDKSNRFITTHSSSSYREIFPDGDWVSIKEDLALSGWDPMQSEHIHTCLKNGVSLSSAIRRVANDIGRCPIYSKRLF